MKLASEENHKAKANTLSVRAKQIPVEIIEISSNCSLLLLEYELQEMRKMSFQLNLIDVFKYVYTNTRLRFTLPKLDASAFSKQGAMNLYKNLNLDALMISTKRIYGLLVLLGGAVLIYVSFLNLEGLGKRKLVLLRKRLKGQSVKGYTREVESEKEEAKTEATAASGTAI